MTTDERNNLLRRYKRDPLFRQWLPTLGELARAGHGGEVEIWHEAERALCRLKREADWREAEVQLIYSDLSGRYPESPLFCLAVMAVLLTCLADAAPSLDRVDENPYRPICVAILVMLDGDRRFHALLGGFFGRSRDNRGERVVLPVTDYLTGPVDEFVVDEAETSYGILERLVDNALERDDADRLSALKLRLYELDRPALTTPLIERVNKRIAALRAPRPTTQNIFNDGASQINQSTLRNPMFGTAGVERILPNKAK